MRTVKTDRDEQGALTVRTRLRQTGTGEPDRAAAGEPNYVCARGRITLPPVPRIPRGKGSRPSS